MRKIVDVHHPNLDSKLLDQVLIKFYWLRGQPELRKKPSTSELIDWISALLRSGHHRGTDEAHIPFLGSLLKNEQDTAACRTSKSAAVRCPSRGRISVRDSINRARPLVAVHRRPSAPRSRPMFLDLFYGLRDEGVPVAIQEWQMFMTCLENGLHDCDLLSFYNIAKACLVKSETYFDAFDRVFARVFHGVEGELSVTDELMEWLNDPKNFEELTEEQRQMLEELDADELMRRFLETLAEQDERHDGGGKWVGTGGRSPFGHGGEHPTGIRVGGQSRNRSAMKVAEDRRFKDYRTDATLDLRNTKLALKRLRHLTRAGPDDELDIDETIDTTCKNAGEIDLVFRPERRNNVRLLLFMDVGGTMDPYYEPVSRLLTALHEERGLRDFKAYYFHNCIYEAVGTTADLYMKDAVPTGDVLRRLDERWKVRDRG